MEKQETYYTIDLAYLFKSLAKRSWIIIISAIVSAAIGFSWAAFFVTPTYASYIKLFVNNGSISVDRTNNYAISTSDLTAAQSLVKTYSDILNSRSTLERVITKADVNYSWKELSRMITAVPSNDTEVMKVTVVSTDPYEASRIANTIARVLPVRISEIIDNASMEVVDTAVPNLSKIAPSVTRYTAIALLIGVALSVSVIIIYILLDDKVYDEEYILEKYSYPLLGKIPNLVSSNSKSYYYYSRNKASTQQERG